MDEKMYSKDEVSTLIASTAVGAIVGYERGKRNGFIAGLIVTGIIGAVSVAIAKHKLDKRDREFGTDETTENVED